MLRVIVAALALSVTAVMPAKACSLTTKPFEATCRSEANFQVAKRHHIVNVDPKILATVSFVDEKLEDEARGLMQRCFIRHGYCAGKMND